MSARHWILVGILLLHLALAIAFSVMVPLAEAPDEADHWAYIIYLVEERRLPVGASLTQSKHPPLYHLSAAAIASMARPSNDFLHPNPDVDLEPAPDWSPNFFTHTDAEAWPWRDGVLAFHLVRLWSALLSTLTLAAVYGLARAAFPKQVVLALAATGVLAFLPEFAFIGGAITNDNAAALFGTLSLWGGAAIYRAGGRLRAGWWTPLALGAGLLSKTSTVGVWPAVGLAIILVNTGGNNSTVPTRGRTPLFPSWYVRHHVLGAVRAADSNADNLKSWLDAILRRWRHWLMAGIVIFGLGLLIASPWLLRNWRLYGDPLGLSMALRTIDVRTEPWSWADTRWLLSGWFISFWGKFGGAGHIPMPSWVYGLLGLISLASLGGLLLNLLPDRRRFHLNPLSLLLLAVLGVAAVMWRYSLMALGTDQGRLLYPAIGALIILFVAGLLSWFPARFERRVAIALVCMMMILASYVLAGVIRPAFADSGVASGAIQRIDMEEKKPLVLAFSVDAMKHTTTDSRNERIIDWLRKVPGEPDRSLIAKQIRSPL